MSFPEPEFQIMVNEGAMQITVGSILFDRPFLHRTGELNMHIKEQICGAPPSSDVKEMHKFHCAKLGPKFNRRFQAANYWLWVGNRMGKTTGDMLRQSGSRWRAYSGDLVFRANQVLPYVNEAERDGLYQLIPAIVTWLDSPKNIRQKIGPAAWRKIASASRSRNKKIMQAVDRRSLSSSDEMGEMFVHCLGIPSNIMGAITEADDDEQIAARLAPLKTPPIFEQTHHIVRDTHRMVGADFNPDWSLARMNEEHDLASRRRYSVKYSDEPFAAPWGFERDGYTAKLLNTEMEIAGEGSKMHHCVGSYAREASSKKYLVVRIEGKERATAGYRKEGKAWRLEQVYGVCNAMVTDACRSFAINAAVDYAVATRAVAA